MRLVKIGLLGLCIALLSACSGYANTRADAPADAGYEEGYESGY